MVDPATDYRDRIYGQYASLFQDAAPTFDAAAADQWGRAYDYHLRGWLPERKDAAIADLACGGGKLLHFLTQRGYTNVSGVDISPQQVQLARQVMPQVTQASLFEFLDTHQAAFDLLIGLDVIEHFHKSEVVRFLDACLTALRPGARLILQTPNAESPWGTHLRYDDFTHEIAFAPNPLTRLLIMCGATQVVCRELAPVKHGYSAASTFRWLLWQGLRGALKLYNVIETGSIGSGVYTRVFLVACVRKPSA